jgi:malic enzyme
MICTANPKPNIHTLKVKKDPTSWTKSIYQTDSSVYPNRLNNKVLTIAPDKTIIEKEIGVEYDAIIDNRFNEALTYTPGVSYNTEVFSLLIFPIIIPANFTFFIKG